MIEKGEINGKDCNGALSEDQMTWLFDGIKDAEAKGLKNVLFAHHGIFPKHRLNLFNDVELLEKITKIDSVKAYINGHNHHGDYGVKDGLHCWTIESMLDYEDKTAYATVDVYEDRFEINGRGRVGSKTMKLRK